MNITVNLLHVTPLEILVGGIRQCYESQDKSDSFYQGPLSFDGKMNAPSKYILGPKDKALIERITKDGHGSTLEHITFNFQIKGISRLCLQELARHRMASYSVKSTRYTLKELKNEEEFNDLDPEDWERAIKYINLVDIAEIDSYSIMALEKLRRIVVTGLYTNDTAKYIVPECYRLDLYMSINARSLTNFFGLRRSERAHFEIHELADRMFEVTPEDYKFLFEDK